MNKVSFLALSGAAAGVSVYYFFKPKKGEPAKVEVKKVEFKNLEVEKKAEDAASSLTVVNWDKNWDHRPAFENCKAVRHIILVRHGQYNLKGSTDVEKTLTAIGREQAKLTGQRIAKLELPISDVVFSTMTRAQETGNIIISQLPNEKPLRIVNDSLIREGEPIQEGKKLNHL